VSTLNGTIYKKYNAADAYGHIKGMIAFYAAALAIRNHDVYFTTVSPGSTRDTRTMEKGQFPVAASYLIKGFIHLSGQHDVDVGAKRYIDALLGSDNGAVQWDYPSGSFL
jgi:hypothetical protein